MNDVTSCLTALSHVLSGVGGFPIEGALLPGVAPFRGGLPPKRRGSPSRGSPSRETPSTDI